MTDYTANYKNPMPVVVMVTVALTAGYMACFGMIADNKEVVRSHQVRPVKCIITAQEANAATMLDLYGQDWYGKGCGRRRCR